MAAAVVIVVFWCMWSLEIPQTVTVCHGPFCVSWKCMLMAG